MMTPIHSMQALFEQLGLDSQPANIAQFIQEHSLRDSMKLHEAGFWTPSQAQFLKENLSEDADWAEVIDELNALLHRH